jgi:hypothetical protein
MVKKDEVLQQKSPAEFFADNKNIAGFDNVGPKFPSSFHGVFFPGSKSVLKAP